MDVSDSHLTDLQFVAFDLETTGLSPDSCRIVEFGAIRFQLDGTVLGKFNQLVDPSCPIPPRVTRIHGITNAMVRGMPSIAKVHPRFLHFLDEQPAILLAHNAAFDLGFLRSANAKTSTAQAPDLANPVLDTLQLARRALPGLYRYRLLDLAINLQLADSEDHRAFSDACLVMKVFSKLVQLHRKLTTRRQLLAMAPPLNIGFRDAGDGRPEIHHRHLVHAVRRQQAIVMVYEGGSKGLSQRRVTPRRLTRWRGTQCLIAYCHIDQVEKNFRVDRIRDLQLLDE